MRCDGSDQGGVRIRAVGAFPAGARLGVVTGVIGWGAPSDFGRRRRALGAPDSASAHSDPARATA